ncbi:c-type cytochrome [Methyloceanibacter stevinii]|uniref:c-type cytochrome n=1 Tax=Methyloceanibacter stevinii TaxID=1774970 RepID=UPI0009F60C03
MTKHLVLAAAAIAAFSASDALAADADHGKQLYATCAACHGPTGAGNEALGAPPIAGMPLVYGPAAEQLQNGCAGRQPQGHPWPADGPHGQDAGHG